MERRQPQPLLLAFISCIFFIMACSGCATLDSRYNEENKLRKSIERYNSGFETRRGSRAAIFVHREKRGEFLLQIQPINERVTFFERSIIDIAFFIDGNPAKMTSSGPEEGFNKAVVMLRYQLSRLPSNQLKILFTDQEWVKEEDSWFVKPDLSPFLK